MNNHTTKHTSQSYDVIMFNYGWLGMGYQVQPSEFYREASEEGWGLVESGLSAEAAFEMKERLEAGEITVEEIYELAG